MGWTNTTLFILNKKHKPKFFITVLNEQLKELGFVMLAEDFICFNDSVKGEEKETIDFDQEVSEQQIIELLVSWKGLGMLEYTTPECQFPVVVNFLSWDDNSLEGFTINLNGKDAIMAEPEKHKEFINKIAGLVNFRLVIGDFTDYYSNELSDVFLIAEQGNFNIMMRHEV